MTANRIYNDATPPRVSRSDRVNIKPTTIIAIGSHNMWTSPKRCDTCPTMTGAKPPPNNSATAITSPDAVAANVTGTLSIQIGPTVSVIKALLNACTANKHANKVTGSGPQIASNTSEIKAPSALKPMTGRRPTLSDNHGNNNVPTVEPTPIADITVGMLSNGKRR